MNDEMILVPRAELLAWAKAWLYDYDPNDGTDCVTPFDAYLLKTPAEAQAQGGGDMTECGHSKYDQCHNCEPLDAPPSAPVGVELLCRVYADAYHAGHHATVEGCYVDVLPVDRDTYWREKVQEDYPEALAQQPAAVECDCPIGQAEHASWCAISKTQDAQQGGA